jgi:hypothetical protein
MVALDLRNDRISLEKAEHLVSTFEGKKPPSLDIFLDYLGLTQGEFNEIVGQTVVPPNHPDFNSNEWSPKTWDFDRWYRETGSDKGISSKTKTG